jgi:hypothetical protein
VATGRVTDACTERHRHQEFSHKLPAVRAWLRRHRRVQLHFTPTLGSWLNLVEAFFSIITRQALRRGNFPTVADLIAAIQHFIDAWNNRCAPSPGPRTPTASSPRPPIHGTARHNRCQIRSTRKRVQRSGARTSPQLLTLPGCGPQTAAKLIGETAHPARCSSEAHFARHAGVALIPACSGKTT